MASVTRMAAGEVLDFVFLSPIDFAERLELAATLRSAAPTTRPEKKAIPHLHIPVGAWLDRKATVQTGTGVARSEFNLNF